MTNTEAADTLQAIVEASAIYATNDNYIEALKLAIIALKSSQKNITRDRLLDIKKELEGKLYSYGIVGECREIKQGDDNIEFIFKPWDTSKVPKQEKAKTFAIDLINTFKVYKVKIVPSPTDDTISFSFCRNELN